MTCRCTLILYQVIEKSSGIPFTDDDSVVGQAREIRLTFLVLHVIHAIACVASRLSGLDNFLETGSCGVVEGDKLGLPALPLMLS